MLDASADLSQVPAGLPPPPSMGPPQNPPPWPQISPVHVRQEGNGALEACDGPLKHPYALPTLDSKP